MAASIPLKTLGTVEDIGYAALFLTSKRRPTSPDGRSFVMVARSS